MNPESNGIFLFADQRAHAVQTAGQYAYVALTIARLICILDRNPINNQVSGVWNF